MIQKIIEFSGTVADREHTFTAVELFLCVCDLPGTVEVEITVTHKFCVHPEILHIRFSDHTADGIGNAADAELKRAAAGDIGEDIRSNFAIRIRRCRALDCWDREAAFNDCVHIVNADMVIGQSGNGRHCGVYFHHDMLCRIQYFLHRAVCKAIGEVAVFIHRSNGNHGYIDRCISFPVIGAVMPKHHW